MDWRQQSSVDYESAFSEAQRWIEAVTQKRFGSSHFRSSLENGVLLCDLINNIKPGIIKKLNRLSTPIAGLDNLNIFLKACGVLGLNQAQLFHPGDLQDLSTRGTVKYQESSRRLKNVLITLYWLGRKAYADPLYNGPYLKLKAFEGLLGKTLYKALEDYTSLQGSARNGWYSEKEELLLLTGHKREDSLDSLDSLDSRTYSISSDTTLKGSSEGCGSDPEADLSFTMSESKEYRRSLVVTPKTTTQFNQFLPSKDKQSGHVPAPLRKKRVERNDDNRQSWGAPLYTDEDGNFARLLQEASSTDGSQSVGDITEQMNLSNLNRELRFEELRKMREQMKENEEQWQNDLSRWKSKRRSVNSDIVKKKEEREEIDQITSTSNFRRSKTFSEMQDERESRGQTNRNSFNFSSDDVFEEPVPRRRTLQQRSYTIDTPYAPTDKPSAPSVPSLMEEEPIAGTLASEQTDLPTKRDNSGTRYTTNSVQESQTTTQSLLDDPAPVISGSNTSLLKPTSPIKPTASKRTITSTVLNSSQQSKSIDSTKPVENNSSSISFVNKTSSMETKQPGSDQVSAFLPRSYRGSDSSRLTSVVTPRPFGTQANRVTSLPRTFMVEDSHKRMNGERDSLKKPAVPSRYAQFALEDENLSQGSPVQSSNEEEEEERSAAQTPSPVPPINRVSPLSTPNEGDYSDMRISLNQKPNSSQDFGLQTNWDSTGVRVLSVVPGSPAEHCQVKVGDEVLTVNGHRVADMSYNEWKNSMDVALKQGSLLMDVRRQGGNNWGRDQPSLPFKSHKTINLTSLDPLGSSEKRLSANLDFTSHQKDTIVQTVNVSSQSANNYGSNGMNGGFREDSETKNNKESISLKNLKRRSEFFEQGSTGLSVSSLVYLCGGSETEISNLPVPSITTSSTRWSWDQEDERRRQEKWQKEQERLLQEKYKKDQEKLEEEWKKAQKDFALSSKNEKYETEVQEASRLAQEEERKRREQERQHLEEERRKREAQQRLEDERKKREEEVRLRQEAERKRREEERRQQEEQDKMDTFGYTNAYRELSYSHRSLSKSTPELDEPKPDIKGVYSRHRGLAGWLLEEELRRKNSHQVTANELELERRNIVNAMKYRNPERAGSLSEVGKDYKKEPQSYAEVERQQIIEDMKKKTPLNTDSSWIRQQSLSSNTAKQPVNLAMRRGESLDNLDVPRPSWRSSWAPGSTSSIPDYSRPYSALSSSSSNHSGRPGSAAFQTSQSMSSLRQSWSPSTPPSATSPDPESKAPPRNKSVSGRKICSFCKTPLGKGAAMIIESLGLCFHLTCFKCIGCKSELGGSEAGAEVRIRNQQLYCNTCYMRLKTGQPTAM
ncbi:LIM domain only protein 7 isoform X1 [Triplophysa dalaica]|uniref:LIM domain only protein 7 isoform X1 n=1 Tax=Triplophysa dalaica TaxID=1582913 RepID=UPI0024DF9E24|nr:LIM domain only protein 7 isoform X1 [Triplophysa dalaica]